jgi:phosphatidylglycerol:prolipoprotein diacylglycerol transferase
VHPVLVTVGAVTIRTWGFMAALGVMLGALLAGRLARARGLEAEDTVEALVVACTLAIVTARLTFVVLRAPFFVAHPGELLDLRAPGLSSLGGLVGLLLGGAWCARRHRLDPLDLLDVIAPAILLVVAVGRVGCLLNGCCYGTPSAAPWAVALPNGLGPRHPAPLYEAILVGALAASLSQRLARARPGAIVLGGIGGYALIRFLVEFVRDGIAVGLGLTLAQWVCLLISACAPACSRILCSSRSRPGSGGCPRS